MQRSITWHEMWNMSPLRLAERVRLSDMFCPAAVTHLLMAASLQNLFLRERLISCARAPPSLQGASAEPKKTYP